MKGILLSITASVTFGILYFYSQLFHGIDAQQVFAWRMLTTLPFLTLFMYLISDIQLIKSIYLRIKDKPQLLIALLFSSFLACSQLWLFLWGPIQGRGLQVSLGYFLLPIVMVAIGAVIYKEKLSTLQWLATITAAIGITMGLINTGSLAWETLYVAFGYPLYFVFRRAMQFNHLGGFWWDIALSIPLCILMIIYLGDWTSINTSYAHFSIFLLIAIGLGILSTIGLGSYMMASRLLPFGLFGLLSYLEPILLALASFCLGERIPNHNLVIYLGIWCAMSLLILDTTQQYLKKKSIK